MPHQSIFACIKPRDSCTRNYWTGLPLIASGFHKYRLETLCSREASEVADHSTEPFILYRGKTEKPLVQPQMMRNMDQQRVDSWSSLTVNSDAIGISVGISCSQSEDQA